MKERVEQKKGWEGIRKEWGSNQDGISGEWKKMLNDWWRKENITKEKCERKGIGERIRKKGENNDEGMKKERGKKKEKRKKEIWRNEKAVRKKWKRNEVRIRKELKGQCHEIFCFWFFSWISFPQAPEYPIRTVSNFSENSRRYLPTTPVANLPPVSTTLAAKFATSFASVVDTSGKFAAGINDTGVNDTCCKFVTGVNDTGGK